MVAAVHYRRRCAFMRVHLCLCECVLVFGISCKSELGQHSSDVQQQGC